MTTSGEELRRRASVALHPSSPRFAPLDSEVLGVIAEGLASTAVGTPVERGELRRHRILETGAYDAWVIEWGVGATAEAHDHAGSVSVVHVVEGVLLETSTDLLGPAAPRVLDAAGSTALGPAGMHSLVNAGPTEALSVHVYSPPLGD